MKFKTGDKVRFLNEAIEGTVSGILSRERVEVVDSDGFTHIADQRQLVHVEFVPLDQVNDAELTPKEAAASQVQKPTTRQPFENTELLKGIEDDSTIYGIVRLLSPKQPLVTEVELLIGNNTNHLIALTVAKRVNDLRLGLVAGVLKSKETWSVGVFSQDELHQFNGFEIQLLFSGEQEFRPRPPAVKALQFSSTDFLNPEFKFPRDEFNDILLMPIYSFSVEKDVDIKALLEKYHEYNKEEEMRKPAKGGKRSAFTVLTRHKVVDLHIEELVKDHSQMSNAQIISYQLNYFIYEMEQAIVQRLHKITFIHGVGQGVLKNAIREELKKYSGIIFAEAPADKYGYGATEVEFL